MSFFDSVHPRIQSSFNFSIIFSLRQNYKKIIPTCITANGDLFIIANFSLLYLLARCRNYPNIFEWLLSLNISVLAMARFWVAVSNLEIYIHWTDNRPHSSNKKGATFYCNSLILISRGSGIRTHDPLLPKQVR